MSKKNKTVAIDILEQLNGIEQRLSKLENKMETWQPQGTAPKIAINQDNELPADPVSEMGFKNIEIESTVGEIGMAWLGNIVLALGIIFLAQFLQNQDHILLSSIFGFIAVACVYLTGYFIRNNFPYMSTLFTFNGHLLVFFITLRLHFASGDVLLNNKSLALSILLLVVIALAYVSYQKKSQVLGVLVLFMGIVTAIAGNSTYFTLSLFVIIPALSVYSVKKLNWWVLLHLSIILVYAGYIIWLMNNPIMNQNREALYSHQFGHFFLFGTAMLYSMLTLLPEKENIEEGSIKSSIVMNGIAFSILISLFSLTFFTETYAEIFAMISGFCIIYSVFLKKNSAWKITSSMYALYGFFALSVSIYGVYNLPFSFLLLSIQSLLVVSMALWFRSRFIVIMNSLLFFGLLIAYIAYKEPFNSINISFALVALATARILNWKKKRLEIQTEFIRNLYLLIGIFMTLVSLYRAVPTQYVTLSWMLTGMVFFVLSVLIHNVKYRWLAIAIMIITSFKLVIYDLSTVNLGFRIVALLILAVITLGISIFYARRKKAELDEFDQEINKE